ncbi:hypothetical protein MUGA111182_08050 [Mucilaginibacter galii]|uniref:Uncharacterized protein n=1 Tax=Mucilaginibacter galii TaxID=2005073 RepID=A0A917J9C3_9SPHI|nr:hypothetical protein [Mucilaginibacter galii]GGI51520.1 hypothetical protein GCM10011425_27320 [Mucilaginibacter galii]
MEQQFDAILTGSDSQIEGVVNTISQSGYSEAYEFNSIDGTLNLVIARDTDGNWIRIAGSEPYFAGWVDELVEQINNPETNNTAITFDNE